MHQDEPNAVPDSLTSEDRPAPYVFDGFVDGAIRSGTKLTIDCADQGCINIECRDNLWSFYNKKVRITIEAVDPPPPETMSDKEKFLRDFALLDAAGRKEVLDLWEERALKSGCEFPDAPDSSASLPEYVWDLRKNVREYVP